MRKVKVVVRRGDVLVLGTTDPGVARAHAHRHELAEAPSECGRWVCEGGVWFRGDGIGSPGVMFAGAGRTAHITNQPI